MILEVTGEQLAQLNDTDLRTLVGYLCEREMRSHGHAASAVTWGGHQNAADGGIDVRVALLAGAAIAGYVPKAATGFQVKAQDMPRGAILQEMAPGGAVLPRIIELAANGGAYIIVSSQGSLSDTSLRSRKAAMAEALRGLPSASSLTLDFYDRRRIASWVNQHAGLVPWVREKLGLPLSGWRPFEDWSSSPAPVDTSYLLDAKIRLVGPSIKDVDGLTAEQALAMLRGILVKPKGVVRLVGLSGVGKTRLIQALFDDRIGTEALPRSDALYTDISDEPDPVPQEMLSRLISMGHRVVLIVDNCGIELHRKLAAKVGNSDCLLSVITVEYDIIDDEPPNTDVFKLEPASPDLIEKMLDIRCPAIASPSRHVIARFSEGNSRVAFALAETAKNGESLSKLNDTDLFERLFRQQKATSAELLDAAKACALLYSFDGETLEGDNSELVSLAKLAGQTVDQLHKHVAELHRRQLVQKRSQWRAILPHALANRLAKRAFEDVPLQRIENAIVTGSSARMLRSFSRRIGYLHDDERAVALAAKWFATGGLLDHLGKLNTLGVEIFENIAPVSPAATLSFIEEAAAKSEDWFFDDENDNKAQILRVLRSLAYGSDLFGRSASLLQRFVLNEPLGKHHSAVEPLKSLFWLYLSGTYASAAQRTAFIKSLLEGVAAEQEIGLTLLAEMLKTSHFSSHYSFEFGAWKRDFGFHPEDVTQVRDWYAQVIELARAVGTSGGGLSDRVRRMMANHVADLLRAGMLNEVIALATAFTGDSGWPEGWIGVRNAMRRGKGKFAEAAFKELEELEQRLRPGNLAGMIRSHALTPEWSALEIADLIEETALKPLEARQKIHDLCAELGQQLVGNDQQFAALLPEIVAADSPKTFELGRGLATGCLSLAECWSRLRDEFLRLPEGNRKAQLLAGFLTSAMVRSSGETESLLDEVLFDSRLHSYLLNWQACAGLNGKAFERMMRALAIDTVPIFSFHLLANGRAHEGLDDEQLRLLLQGIIRRDGGNRVAAEILGMRVFGRRSDKLPISESLKATGREFLARVELEEGAHLDHMIGEVIEVAFDKPEYEDQARAFCARISEPIGSRRVYAWDVAEIIAALTKTFPHIVLDMLVEQAVGEDGLGRTLFQDIRGYRACPLDAVQEDVWMAWAAQKPETRYELLARVLRFSNAGDEDHAKGWSPAAARLIDVAPEPAKVLDAFLLRFRPSGWSGSLADTLATRAPLIEVLKLHSKAEIAGWATNIAPQFAACIDRERAREAVEDRARDQSFE
ncbi:exonuclease SbcCD subunit D C-terminal domain-containing protein [Rhizobacter sp. Root1221]|uniref:exonuclease SbcCD subunit D C-terminal domain-containing protein n=1 Tax=Rhizobacter sp. Root1221 TaxID=1736433 RepID=UPI0007003EEB|nr:exonuclease SbcCD subunit D C-terminal domain-containing protein [Rhizobacter sp. Root1221]KQV97997.1 hypothetical protein ASC87_22525 [Rhizobacter sp. Root1221]